MYEEEKNPTKLRNLDISFFITVLFVTAKSWAEINLGVS